MALGLGQKVGQRVIIEQQDSTPSPRLQLYISSPDGSAEWHIKQGPLGVYTSVFFKTNEIAT